MPREGSRLIRVSLALAAALWVLSIHVSYNLTGELGFDEAYNLQVPLNLDLGDGYQTWYRSPQPFDANITTGPPVLLPIALAFKLFGASYHVARAVMFVFFVGFLWILYRTGRWSCPARSELYFAAAVVLLSFQPEIVSTSAWVMGELPAVGFYLLAVDLMSGALATEDSRRAGAAGVALGLAVLTKLVLLLCVPAFFVALWLSGRRTKSRGRLALYGVLCAVGSSVPLLAWEGIKLVFLGREGYQENVDRTWRLVQSGGSGLKDGIFAAGWGLAAHLRVFSAAIDVPASLLAIGMALMAVYCIWLFLGRKQPFAAWCILLATTSCFLWWFRFSSWLWYRHLIPGYLLYALLAANVLVELSRIVSRQNRMLQALAVAMGCGAVALTIPPRLPAWRWHTSPALKAQQNAAAMVSALHQQQPQAQFFGFGWCQVPEVSFLAALPFRDLTREPPTGNGPHYLVVMHIPMFGPAEPLQYADTYGAEWVFREGNFAIRRLAPGAPRGHETAPRR